MYSFVCVQCGTEVESREHASIGQSHPSSPCPLCGGRLVRYVAPSFGVQRSMPEHFNIALGKPISNDAQFRSELSRASDEQSERTGMDAHYVPVDIREQAALGVTDEGLDTTAKVRRDSSQVAPTRRIIV